jgi:hypothetical protein
MCACSEAVVHALMGMVLALMAFLFVSVRWLR